MTRNLEGRSSSRRQGPESSGRAAQAQPALMPMRVSDIDKYSNLLDDEGPGECLYVGFFACIIAVCLNLCCCSSTCISSQEEQVQLLQC